MGPTVNVTGKCLCGQIRLSGVLLAAGQVDVCHCESCQKWHGGFGLSMALAEPLKFETGADLVQVHKSSEWGHRSFCKNCGTGLGFSAPAMGYFGVAPGVLEDKSGFFLRREIFVDTKPEYLCFSGERPTMTGAEYLASLPSLSSSEERLPVLTCDVRESNIMRC